METGKLLLWATGAMLVVGVVVVGAVVAPAGLLGGGSDVPASAMPAGVTESGVENASATAQAHRQALEDASYNLSVEATKTVDGSNRDVQAWQGFESDGDGHYLRTFDQRSPQDYTVTTWTNGTVAVSKLERGNQTVYQKNEIDRVTNGRTGSLTVREYLKAGDFQPSTVENVNGQDVVVLTADAPTREASRLLQVNEVTSFSGRVEITPDGVVRSMNVEVEFTTRNGDSGNQEFTQTVTGVGSTDVQKPSWVPAAVEQTSSARLDGPRSPALVA